MNEIYFMYRILNWKWNEMKYFYFYLFVLNQKKAYWYEVLTLLTM